MQTVTQILELILKAALALCDAAKSILPALLVAKAKNCEAKAANAEAKTTLAKAEQKGAERSNEIEQKYAGLHDSRAKLDAIITKLRSNSKSK
jgi:hypothetical protein